MARGWMRTTAAGVCAAILIAVAVYQGQPTIAAPRPDLKPSAHWVFNEESMAAAGARVADRAGKLPGTLLGAPKLVTDRPTPRLEFTTPSDGVLVKDRATKEPNPEATAALAKACHQEGLLVLTCGTYGNVLRFLPPLVIGEDLLNEGLDIIEQAFARI